MHVGKTVSIAIQDKGLTKADLADMMGVRPQRVSRLCSLPGCHIQTLEQIASALDMPLWLFIKTYGGE